jgi:hypothetical protein
MKIRGAFGPTEFWNLFLGQPLVGVKECGSSWPWSWPRWPARRSRSAAAAPPGREPRMDSSVQVAAARLPARRSPRRARRRRSARTSSMGSTRASRRRSAACRSCPSFPGRSTRATTVAPGGRLDERPGPARPAPQGHGPDLGADPELRRHLPAVRPALRPAEQLQLPSRRTPRARLALRSKFGGRLRPGCAAVVDLAVHRHTER